MSKPKIGIIIENVIRNANVKGALNSFLEVMQKTISTENEETEYGFWDEEFKKEEVIKFYEKFLFVVFDEKKIEEYDLNNLRELFYNDAHYAKFIEETTYVIFNMAEKKCADIFDYFNLISQKFDLILFDKILFKKQSKYTLSFLSKYTLPFIELRNREPNETDTQEMVYIFDNLKNSEEFDKDFVLNKLKELELDLNKK